MDVSRRTRADGTAGAAGADEAGAARDDARPLSVQFVPDYTDENPYQERLAAALRERGVRVSVTTGGGGPLPLVSAVLAGGRPDVVHVHFLHQFAVSPADRFGRPLSALLAVRTAVELVALKLLGVSLVWTAHDLFEHERTAPRVEAAFKHVAIRVLLDAVIVHCAAARDALVDAYRLPPGTLDATVVPHGHFRDDYPDEVSRAAARAELGVDVPDGGTVFGFFGLIRPYKNVTGLIEAVGRLPDDDVRLLVAGNPHTDRLRRAVEAAAAGDDRVRLTLEFVPVEAVQYHLSAADVVVAPFRTDRRSTLTSGSVLLAMGFGRPVVAPDVGCVGEAVAAGDGLVYDPADDDGLDDALQRATEADLVARGRRSRAVAERRTWARAADRTLDVYRDAA